MSTMVRPCTVCGLFYPGDQSELSSTIAALLDSVQQTPGKGVVRGLISPHAGYMFSGYTAAHGYKRLRNAAYDTVVIVSPSHREYFNGISVYPGDAYATPLGVVSIDAGLRAELCKQLPLIHLSHQGHGEEHAVEVQLPFLQTVLKDFSFLPVVIGDQARFYCEELGHALARVLKGRNALLIASTDLSHYHPYNAAVKLDSVFIEDVRRMSPESLMEDLESGKTEGCGGGPTVAALIALRMLGVVDMEILHHCNSGDVTGDHSGVVGYLSAAAYA